MGRHFTLDRLERDRGGGERESFESPTTVRAPPLPMGRARLGRQWAVPRQVPPTGATSPSLPPSLNRGPLDTAK